MPSNLNPLRCQHESNNILQAWRLVSSFLGIIDYQKESLDNLGTFPMNTTSSLSLNFPRPIGEYSGWIYRRQGQEDMFLDLAFAEGCLVCSTAAAFWCKSCCCRLRPWPWDGDWQLSGVIRLTQITSQATIGEPPLFTASWLQPYIDLRVDQYQKTYHWADMAHCCNEEQMGQREGGHTWLCCGHVSVMTV